jgi:arylsulfatase A-like enzyme
MKCLPLLPAALLLGLSTGACRSGEATSPAAPPRRPNLVFVFSDDHSPAAIGAYGSRINETPGIDRLAREGMTFDTALVTNSICAPSRAVILTGKHSPANGVRDNGAVFDGAQTTFPKLLQEAGYATAMIGKWHLKSDPTGFDHWEVLPGQGHYYNPDFRSAAGTRRIPGHVTDITTELAIEWLETGRDASKPFLLMCQHKAPHRSWMPAPEDLALFDGVEIPEPATLFDDYATRGDAARQQEMEIDRHMYFYYDLKVPPLDPDAKLEGPDRWTAEAMKRLSTEQRERFLAAFAEENEAFHAAGLEGRELVRWKYQRYIKNYLRCIAGVDRSVGQLLDWLEENDLAEDTIVIYASDQGFYLGEHGWYDKRFMYEPSLRMPLLVRWPGVTAPGSRDDHLVQNLDLGPTLLEAAGVAVPSEMQGESFLPLLRGLEAPDWREVAYYEYFERGIHNVAVHRGVRTARHKLIHFHELDQWELYDLETDPEELQNRHGDPALAEVQARLEAELERLRALYGDAPAGEEAE